ncbi:MAG: NHL repeat-containing protein [Coriobacteriia bacterium]|nr:NHL repeat-containing protein [Coriobacteriia bacterium]
MTDPITSDTMTAAAVRSEARPTGARSSRGRKIMIVLLVFLALLLCSGSYLLLRFVQPAGEIATTEEARGIEWVRSIYGWGDGPGEQLQQPASVAIDSSGRILVPSVADTSQVYRFGADGAFVDSFFGNEAEGRVLFPTGVTVGPDDSIYIVQSTQGNLLKLTPDGQQTLLQVDVDAPTAVAVTDDRIFVGAKAGFAILDMEGSPIEIIGTQGFEEDQFDTVSGLAVDEDDNIYVVDTYNNRISKFDRNGQRLWIVKTGNPANRAANEGAESLTIETDAPAAMQTPGAAVIDGAGRLVVLDMLDFSLAVFDPENGDVIAKYGTYGTEEGTFMYPSGLAYDPDRDWFAVADLGNNRVQIVRLPDSSASTVLPSARRALTGSLRALFLPLILLIIGLAYWLYRTFRDMRSRRAEDRARA